MILLRSRVLRFGGPAAQAQRDAAAWAEAIGRTRCTVGPRSVTLNAPVEVEFPAAARQPRSA